MLDIRYIREHQVELKNAILQKRIELNLDELLDVDTRRRDLLSQTESLQALRNQVSKDIPSLVGDEKQTKILEMREVGDRISSLEATLAEVEKQYMALMCKVPTVPAGDTPMGTSDEDNVEVEKWGDVRDFDFEPKSHIELGSSLGILDLERGVKVAGFRGYYVMGDGALLEMGLMMYAMKKMVERGYKLMVPPTMVKEFALFGSGYFKGSHYNPETDEIYRLASKDKDQTGSVSSEDKFLVGTAEPSLLAYHSGEVLQESELPLRLAGFSPCYRSEIGSYGRDTKGIYRVHEFFKVEQVVISQNSIEEADRLQQEMMEISKELHRDLGIPYRVLRICTGDLSAGKYKQFDLEAWIPSRKGYGETGSSSNFLDWQSRRLDVKYQTKDGKKEYVYMLNNTALPAPRVLIAILENYQNADGSVNVPEVLRPYVGKDKISR